VRLLLLIPTTTYRAEDFTDAARRLGVEVTAASEHASTLSRQSPASLIALPFSDPPAAARRAKEFAQAYPIDAVVGVDDGSVLPAAAIAAALGMPHNPVDAVAKARNKYLMRQALEAAGLPYPPYALFCVDDDASEIAGRVPYPCVLKPLALSASRGVIRADNDAEFAAAFHRIAAILKSAAPELEGAEDAARHVLVEGFIPGREVALEGLLTAADLRVLCLFDKPDPLDGPYFEETLYVTPSRLPAGTQRAVVTAVRECARALGLREGPLHAELRVNDAGAWVLEVNPRSIGGRCSRVLRFGAGMSLEEIILRHALRKEIPSLDRESRAAGVMMLPIPRAGVLRQVRGQEAAAAVPGIEELILTAHEGQQIVPLPEGAPYLGFLFARAASPEAVESALREAHRRLEFEID